MSKLGKYVQVSLALLSMVAFCLAFSAHIPHSHHLHKHLKSVADVTDTVGANCPAALASRVFELPEPAHARAIPQYRESISPVLAGEFESPTTRPPPLPEYC